MPRAKSSSARLWLYRFQLVVKTRSHQLRSAGGTWVRAIEATRGAKPWRLALFLITAHWTGSESTDRSGSAESRELRRSTGEGARFKCLPARDVFDWPQDFW